MVRTNVAVWIVAVVILVATVVVVVVTGHRQGDPGPITGGQAPAPTPVPVRAALAGLGLGPELFEPRGPGGGTPSSRRPAELSSSNGINSRSAASGGGVSAQPAVVPQVVCQPSLIQSVLGLITSLLGGGGPC